MGKIHFALNQLGREWALRVGRLFLFLQKGKHALGRSGRLLQHV